MEYFDQMLSTYICMPILSNHWHAQQPVLVDKALLSIVTGGCGQLVKMLITLEPHGIFGLYFAYLSIIT